MSTPLRLARETRGLTTREVAKAVDINQSHYVRVEGGKRPSPTLANSLAKFFDNAITRDQILFPEDYPERKKPSARIRRPQLQEAS